MMILPTVKCLSKARMGKPRVVFGLSSKASPSNLTRPYRHNQGKMESRIGSFMKVHEYISLDIKNSVVLFRAEGILYKV